jgi:hypothetical protein
MSEEAARKAYEEDCRRKPTYENNGGQRRTWDELPDLVKNSWRKNPTPRTYKHDDSTTKTEQQ